MDARVAEETIHRLATVVVLLTCFSAPAGARSYVHQVLPGETLSSIAKRYKITPAKIRKLNHLQGDQLRQGQRLRVQSAASAPSRLRTRHLIKRGETPVGIARRHHMSLAELKRMNPGLDPSGLRPGKTVWVLSQGCSRGGGSGAGGGRELYQLEPGPGFDILDRGRAWGTMLAVSRVAEVLSAHGIKYLEAAPILVGDLSRERGGRLAPHRSHRHGRDVDIRYPLLAADRRYVAATPATLDVKRTWSLLHDFIDTGDLQYIFVDYSLQRILRQYAESKGYSAEKLSQLFQYPRSRHSMTGLIRHEPGHRTHFHLRFKGESDSNGPNS